MDKFKARLCNEAHTQQMLDQLACDQDSEQIDNRKITPEEWLKSSEFQRRAKIAKERQQRAESEKGMTLREAQELNPIKPRPRKKRGRKRKT